LNSTVALIVGTLLGYAVSITQTIIANRAAYKTKRLEIILTERISAYSNFLDAVIIGINNENNDKLLVTHNFARILASERVRESLSNLLSLLLKYRRAKKENDPLCEEKSENFYKGLSSTLSEINTELGTDSFKEQASRKKQ